MTMTYFNLAASLHNREAHIANLNATCDRWKDDYEQSKEDLVSSLASIIFANVNIRMRHLFEHPDSSLEGVYVYEYPLELHYHHTLFCSVIETLLLEIAQTSRYANKTRRAANEIFNDLRSRVCSAVNDKFKILSEAEGNECLQVSANEGLQYNPVLVSSINVSVQYKKEEYNLWDSNLDDLVVID